jgi:hypothetical protein
MSSPDSLFQCQNIKISINQERTKEYFGWRPSKIINTTLIFPRSPQEQTSDVMVSKTTASTIFTAGAVCKKSKLATAPTLRPIDRPVNFLSIISWDQNLKIFKRQQQVTAEDFLPMVVMNIWTAHYEDKENNGNQSTI